MHKVCTQLHLGCREEVFRKCVFSMKSSANDPKSTVLFTWVFANHAKLAAISKTPGVSVFPN
jgi:hypothetical protein